MLPTSAGSLRSRDQLQKGLCARRRVRAGFERIRERVDASTRAPLPRARRDLLRVCAAEKVLVLWWSLFLWAT